MRFAILARKGISIVARRCWQKQTWYMCIFFVSNVKEHRQKQTYMCIFFVLNVKGHYKWFLKTRAVRNSCSKRNIDRSAKVLAETDMIYVYIFHSKRERTPAETDICVYSSFSTWKNTTNDFLKRVRFAILARKGISIVAQGAGRNRHDICVYSSS